MCLCVVVVVVVVVCVCLIASYMVQLKRRAIAAKIQSSGDATVRLSGGERAAIGATAGIFLVAFVLL